MSRPTSWREDLVSALADNGETFDDIESATPALDSPEMNAKFYYGYGSSQGCSFTVWTKARVYFPAVYDGAGWIASVPRNPNGEASGHVGG